MLIKPEAAPTQTESGLHLSEHWKPEQMGTVLAVGEAVHPKRDEAMEVAATLRRHDFAEVADLLDALTVRAPLVQPGDFVIFSWQAGQEVFDHDADTRFLILKDDDLIAVVES